MTDGPVLVYQIGSLGDTIVSIPCYRAVRKSFPGRRVGVLQARLRAGRVHPGDILLKERLTDFAVSYDHQESVSAWRSLVSLFRAVRSVRPSALVYVGPADRAPKSVKRDRLFFRLAGVKRLAGFRTIDYSALLKKGPDGRVPPVPHQALSRLRRLAEDGLQVDESADMAVPMLHPTMEERERAMDWLSSRRNSSKRLLAMGVSTAQPATRWPVERFRQVGHLLKDHAEILVVGGPGEQAMAESLVDSWGEGIVAAGAFDVLGMAGLLGQCDLYLGLDTGTTHIAAAAGVPVVALYSDHNAPGEWDPLGEGHRVLTHRVPCGGCRLKECPVAGHPCMNGISVEEVVEAVSSRLLEAGVA